MRAASVRKIGASALDTLNRTGDLPIGLASGGAVGYSPERFDSPAANIPVELFDNFGRNDSRIQVELTGKLRGNTQELQMARTG